MSRERDFVFNGSLAAATLPGSGVATGGAVGNHPGRRRAQNLGHAIATKIISIAAKEPLGAAARATSPLLVLQTR